MRKPIIVIGMLNSIHLAKWLRQFQNRELDIYLFPSSYFKKLHPQILDLMESKTSCGYIVPSPSKLFGILDYFSDRWLSPISVRYSRVERLRRAIAKIEPRTVHAVEFQHAGYLVLDFIDQHGKNFELISTNWGSDIFYFQNDFEHYEKISRLLKYTDRYSAECFRDVELALKFGFQGEVLPIVPNSGGFPADSIYRQRSKASTRTLVLIKSYGGLFGRTGLILETIPSLCREFPDISFYFYSVTADLEPWIQNLLLDNPGRLEYSTVSDPLNYYRLQELFGQARIYVGCSISDGISTSFLESLVSGAYPVQTKTSCADEWVLKGAIASIVNLDSNEILNEISIALKDDELVDRAQRCNQRVAIEFLDSDKIAKTVQSFY